MAPGFCLCHAREYCVILGNVGKPLHSAAMLFRAKVYTRQATAAALIDGFRGVATKTDHKKTIVAIPDKLSAQQNWLNLCERVAVYT